MKRSSRVPVVVVAAVLGIATNAAAAPPRGARAAAAADLTRGRYAAALRGFERAARAGDRAARVDAARVLLLTGAYARAVATARAALAAGGAAAPAAREVLAEGLLRSGQVAAARRELEALVKARPRDVGARVLLARVRGRLGDAAGVARACGAVMDAYDARQVDTRRAADLQAVAAACALCGSYKDASQLYHETLVLEPHRHAARVAWGELLLSNYNSAEAAQSFREVLAVDPHHPDAHYGLARVALAETFDVGEAASHLDQALASNPHHVGALVTRGEIALAEERPAAATAAARAALAVDPTAPEALTLLGGAAYLAGDRAGYAAARARALKQNPHAAGFFHGVAEYLSRHHRYREAITLEEEAIRLDPKDARALAALGQHYLRMGDEPQGLAALRRAWKEDPYNARTYNILNLFEDVIAKQYRLSERGHFRLRLPQGDAAVLAPYAFAALEKAYRDLARRYGGAPPGRIQVELYAGNDEFAVRTVGLPGFGAAGVCFGNVIAALSPRRRHLNWSMVLWHELAHAFAIHLSRSRVPRWFTEGLSEWETAHARPEWRRHQSAEVAAVVRDGTLPHLATFNQRFTRARSLEQIVVAYHLAGLVVDYLVRRYGFPAILHLLRLWGEGLPTDVVFRRATGESLAGVDAAFRADLAARLAPYLKGYAIRYERYRDLAALERAARERPRDAAAQAALGFGAFARKDLRRAQTQADLALTLRPGFGEALVLRGEIAMARRDAAAARRAYRAALAAGLDGYDLRVRLGIVALRAGDLAEGERELAEAKRRDPDAAEPYSELIKAYDRAGRAAAALRELAGLAALDPNDAASLTRLVTAYAAAGRNDQVLVWAPRLIAVDPFAASVHVAYARALRAVGRRAEALAELETALRCAPPDAPALRRQLELWRRTR